MRERERGGGGGGGAQADKMEAYKKDKIEGLKTIYNRIHIGISIDI